MRYIRQQDMFCMFVPLLTVRLSLFASVRHRCRPSAYIGSRAVRREAVHQQEHILLSDGLCVFREEGWKGLLKEDGEEVCSQREFA